MADPAPAARERARELTGAERLYEDYRQLLADETVDVVVLLTQPTIREEVIAADVAARTGFESSYYFCRVFRRLLRTTPAPFRQEFSRYHLESKRQSGRP